MQDNAVTTDTLEKTLEPLRNAEQGWDNLALKLQQEAKEAEEYLKNFKKRFQLSYID